MTTSRIDSNIDSIVVMALALILLLSIAGCGGDKEEEVPIADTEAMVPAETPPAATADGSGVEAEQVAAEMESDSSVPGNQDAVSDVGSSAADQVPTAEMAPAESHPAESAAPQSSGPYSVQLGSFQNGSYARARLDQVREAGFEAVIQVVDLDGITYRRVLVRDIADRA